MKKFKTIMGVTTTLLAFGVMAVGSGSSSSQTSAEKIGEVTPSEVVESKSEEDVQPAQTDFYVGDVLKAKGMEVTYVSSGEYESDNQFITPADGNKFIYIELYFNNVGDSDRNVSSLNFKCYADGYAVDTLYYGDNSLSATLSPGRSTDGFIYFEVPKDASEIEVEYETNWLTSEKAKFIYEGEKQSGFVPDTDVTASESAFKVNDVLSTGDLNITYLSCGEYTSDNTFIQPADGNKFVYFELEFENISSVDQHVSSFSFDCYADGMSVDQNYFGGENLDATISPGRKTKGKIMFEVPVGASVIEAEYVDNFWTSDRIIFLYE